MLKRASNTQLGNSPLIGAADILSEKDDLALVALKHAGDEVEHSRLAGTVRADEAEDFAGHNLEANMTHGLEAAEAFHEIVDHQQLGARLRHCSPRKRYDACGRRLRPSRL